MPGCRNQRSEFAKSLISNSHIGILLIAIFQMLLIDSTFSQDLEKRLVGYYTSWSVYVRNYHVPDIPAEMISHVNYAFANISPTEGAIILGDPYADIDRFYPGDSWEPDSLRGCFHQLIILKAQYPHLKTLISVGGWTWSVYFSDIALTEESRHTFAVSCAEFINEYDFDGVDIDWEYPVSGGHPDNHYRPEDRENYTLLLEELREQLDSLEQVNNRDYLLTIAAPANPNIIANIEVELIHQYLDWINVMTYDFHGPWDGPADVVTNFNTPLHVASDDPLEEPYHSSFNLEAAIQNYIDIGVPGEKLHPVLAFYCRAFGNVVNENNGLFADYQGPAPDGTWENGVFDFWDISDNYINTNGYIAYWHNEAKVPWVYNPNTQIMISYDDSISISEKGLFINATNLGGAMFWEFSADRYGMLLSSIHNELSNPTSTGACCSAEGACQEMTEEDCISADHEWMGAGTVCLGDNNNNGIDDACELQEVPTLSEWGLIVLALLILAMGTVAVIRRQRAVIAKN